MPRRAPSPHPASYGASPRPVSSSWWTSRAKPESRPAPGEVEHLHVAVRVAGGEQRTAADAAPDPHGLLGPVVHERRTTPRSAPPRHPRRSCSPSAGADHALGRDAVVVLGHRPHEVAVAARDDVAGEPVRLEVAQQLHHRLVDRVGVRRAAASGASRRGRTRPRSSRSRSTLMPSVSASDGPDHQLQLGVVAGVVLVDRAAEPGEVAAHRGLVRLPLGERRVGFGRRAPTAARCSAAAWASASRSRACRRCRTRRRAPRRARRRGPSVTDATNSTIARRVPPSVHDGSTRSSAAMTLSRAPSPRRGAPRRRRTRHPRCRTRP